MALVPTITNAQNGQTVYPVPGGDFETPIWNTSPFYGYQPVNSEWTWSGAAGVQRNGAFGANAPAGVQTAFLQDSYTPGAFSQNVTLDKGTYKIIFQAARRATGNGAAIQIALDGTALGAATTPTSTAFAAYGTVPFVVTANQSTYRLKFSTLSGGGTSISLIDSVAVQRVDPIDNGGFETPAMNVSPYYGYSPSNSGWNWQNAAGIARNGSLGGVAPEGIQAAFLQDRYGSFAGGAFSQNIVLGAGSYRVRFKAAKSLSFGATPISVLMDNFYLGASINPTSTSFVTYITDPFTIAAGTHTLRFITASGGTGY